MKITQSKKKDLTQEAFDKLLSWLNPDREQAGKKYEDIRRRLIKIFTCRGCLTPEDLTDETIDRVVRKVSELAGSYVGDPTLYFYGVAKNVFHESLRHKSYRNPPPEPETHNSAETEQDYACMGECIQKLAPRSRELILDYYQEERRAKIDHRKQLANRLGIEVNALRIQVCRIRATLYQCIQECLKSHEIT